MAPKRQENDFIKFILDAEKNPKLAEEFLAQKTTKDIYTFFQKKGYHDIPENNCKDILTARNRGRGLYLPHIPPKRPSTGHGRPIPPIPPKPCGPRAGY